MNSVLYLVTVVAIVGSVRGGPTPGDLTIMEISANKCREGTSITKEMVTKLLKGEAGLEEPDATTKCYFKCFFQDIGMMGSDGSIILDANHSHFSDCSSKATQSDPCDKAYNFDKCVHMQFPHIPIA